MSAEAILSRLAEIAKQIEGHRTAIYVLKLERQELQEQLRQSDWAPPPLPEVPA